MDNWCVYRHNCPDGRRYIGITSLPPHMRWDGGLGYQRSNWEFFKYILATGWDNIEHEILYDGLSETEARQKEKEEIQRVGSCVFNYVHAHKEIRAIPPNPKTYWAQLSELEKQALDLWADALYGKVDDATRWRVYKRGYIVRTVDEIESGDPERIEREMEYIAKVKENPEPHIF